MEWDAHTLQVLELDYVRQEWAKRADTPFGREHALTRDLSRDATLVALRLQETDDAVRLLQREPPPPVRGFEPRPALQKAAKAGVLSPDELLSVQRCCKPRASTKATCCPAPSDTRTSPATPNACTPYTRWRSTSRSASRRRARCWTPPASDWRNSAATSNACTGASPKSCNA